MKFSIEGSPLEHLDLPALFLGGHRVQVHPNAPLDCFKRRLQNSKSIFNRAKNISFWLKKDGQPLSRRRSGDLDDLQRPAIVCATVELSR